jgi:hypothetical protein
MNRIGFYFGLAAACFVLGHLLLTGSGDPVAGVVLIVIAAMSLGAGGLSLREWYSNRHFRRLQRRLDEAKRRHNLKQRGIQP